MADDLLNSMLNGSTDDDNSEGLNDLLDAMSSAPEAGEAGSADALGGLADMLGGGGGAPADMLGGGGDLADMLGALSGGGGGPAPADMLGGGGGGGLASILGALGGGGGGGGAMGLLGGMMGMGGAGGPDLSQMPIVGPIINSLAQKFGIPPAQASALVVSALTMLLARKNRAGGARMEELGLDATSYEAADPSQLIAQAAAESGLEEEQAAAGVQEAMQMLLQQLGE